MRNNMSASTQRDAIIECFRSRGGGPLTIKEVSDWIQQQYPRRWKEISTALADLTFGGNPTSTYRENEKCLERVGQGRYQLAPAFMTTKPGP
jgi:hypothetical protein